MSFFSSKKAIPISLVPGSIAKIFELFFGMVYPDDGSRFSPKPLPQTSLCDRDSYDFSLFQVHEVRLGILL
jgi:hypothetical protein